MRRRLLPSILWTTFATCLHGVSAQEIPPCPDGGTSLRWETFARPLFDATCSECHDWGYTDVYAERGLIAEQVLSGNMPPFEPLPRTEIDRFAEWIACGLPLDGPACPPEGSAVTYDNFARSFFASACGSCHSKGLTGEARQGAPVDQSFDDPAAIRRHDNLIRDSVLRGEMPPGGGLPALEIEQLAEWIACDMPGLPGPPPYRRGDANSDRLRDVSDAVDVLAFLFNGTADLECLDAADMDGSGVLNVTDAIYWLGYLFLGGPPPPEPFESCGVSEKLGCVSSTGC